MTEIAQDLTEIKRRRTLTKIVSSLFSVALPTKIENVPPEGTELVTSAELAERMNAARYANDFIGSNNL